jgi:glycosyltransferase involved in cell wall biosynthesis
MLTPRLATRLSERVQSIRSNAGGAASAGAAASRLTIEPSHSVRMRVKPVNLKPVRGNATTAGGPEVTAKRTILCLSHVSPFPPRAGNEYRLHRLLSWLTKGGWDVVLLYCPPPGQEPDDLQLSTLAGEYQNLVYVQHNGEVGYQLVRPDAAAAMACRDGAVTRDVAKALGEGSQKPTARLIPLVRTFCPDVLIESLLALDQALAPHVVLASYIFMSRGLPLLGTSALKVIDTVDVFSTKTAKVLPFGIVDSLAMSAAEEADLLSTANIALAIQAEEASELRKIAPAVRVVTVGVDMPTACVPAASADRRIALLVASGNALNVRGLRDLLRFAWPRVTRALPDAQLHVVGSVGATLRDYVPGVRCFGLVDDLSPIYAAARVVINPAVAGTGLKIKTLEALAHLRPVIVWPSGIEGLPPELRALCETVTDWYAFSEAMIRLLRDDSGQRSVTGAREQIASYLAPESVYAELDRELGHTLPRTGRIGQVVQTSKFQDV